jgi:uncharacterized small protein (DUF1192 family)
MAKALFGHVGQDLDVRMVAELRRMRDRVRQLELEVARLQAANNKLSSHLTLDDDMLTLTVAEQATDREPALT